jgi:hypothetical protein
MAVKVNFNGDTVAARVQGAWDKGLAILTEEILNDSNQFVKVDKHTLENSAMIHSVPKDGIIIWQTPYARRQYWAIQTASKDINPNASWKWFHVAKSQLMGKWEQQAQRLMEMNL